MNINKCKKWGKSLITDNPISKKVSNYINQNYKKELNTIIESKYQILLVAATANLLITLIPIKVIFLVTVICGSLFKIVTTKTEKVLSRGLINYLPETWRNALLNRSILDILCDLWFIPSLSLYIKAMVMPMFDKSIRPSDVSILSI